MRISSEKMQHSSILVGESGHIITYICQKSKEGKGVCSVREGNYEQLKTYVANFVVFLFPVPV